MSNANINLVNAFMQVEGNIEFFATCTNYERKGGVKFSGCRITDGERKHIEVTMDKNQVELINECQTVLEIYKCYKEMEYFEGEGEIIL